jgi:hypothetical protein
MTRDSQTETVAQKTPNTANALMDETVLAQQLNVTVHALRRWRTEGRPPRFIKIGRLVRYRPEDVAAWLDSQPVGGVAA